MSTTQAVQVIKTQKDTVPATVELFESSGIYSHREFHVPFGKHIMKEELKEMLQ